MANAPAAPCIDRQPAGDLLSRPRFKDYGPNGLQVEGGPRSPPGVGVTASLALIDAAIAAGADACWCTTACSGAGRTGR
jgi:hypothetical protein